MNHDPKYNDFEYEKENYPKTPEHFKQFVAAQVTKELSKASIVKHRARKKYFPAKVAAAVIVCAAVGTTGAYAGVKHYQARSQQYLQETGRITAPETSSEEETPAISDNTDSVSPATIVSEENGLITTFSDTWPDVMLEMYDYDSEYQKQPNQYMNVMDAYYDGGLLSIYGEATPYGIKTLGDWFLPDRIVINDTVYLATWNINGIYGDGCDPQYKRGAFHATVELSEQPNQYMNVMDAYYDGGLLSIYGEATPYGIKTLGDWFLPDRIVINDTVYLATWNINGIYGDGCDPQYKRGAFHATVELSDVNLPDTCKVQVPLTTARDPKTGYFYMQTISFDISGNANLKPSVTASSKNGATVTVGESKVSASGTYLSLTWNFGQDKASYEKFHKIISGNTIHNWIYCRITDSNGNTFDTKTDSETFSSIYFDSNDTGDDHWNTSGESTYVDDDGNYCFHTNILLPALAQDFTALEVTPYLHLEDGTETDLDFASFRVDYE